MTKKIISFLMALTMLLATTPLYACVYAQQSDETAAVSAEDDTMSLLAALVYKFPAGKYWNHEGSSVNAPDSVTDTPCASHYGCSWVEGACSCNSFDRAIQCMGYAHKIAYEICGVSPRGYFTKRTSLNADKLRVGDIIRFRNNGHSICVTGVSGSKISFTDCNWDRKCGIRWGVMSLSYITSNGFTYVLHYEDNDRTNTDLTFYEHPGDFAEAPAAPAPEPESFEVWKMSDSNLNIRDTASVQGERIGSVPAGATYKVYTKKYTEDYLWGYIKYGNVKGWAALNYSQFVEGVWEAPVITDNKSEYGERKITLSWDGVAGADYYLFRLYDSDTKIINQYNVRGEKTTFTVPENGKYYAKVFSRSSHAPSWIIASKTIVFRVNAEETADITSIKLNKAAVTLSVGDAYQLKAELQPAEAQEQLIWKSSDEKVATVNGQGRISAVGCGAAKITCSSASGTVSAVCKLSVKPGAVNNVRQVREQTTTGAIALAWDEVKGVDGYDIHRYNASKKAYEYIGSTEDETFTDETVLTGSSYYYLVRGYGAGEAGRVNGANTKVRCSSKPDKVTGVKQTYSATGKISLGWDKVKNASKYVVYVYDSAQKKYLVAGIVDTNSITLEQTAGESRYYRVYAATATSWGYVFGVGSALAFTTSGPQRTTLTAESDKKGEALLSWEKEDNAYYYDIYRYNGSAYVRIARLRSDKLSYRDTDVKSGKSYHYSVRVIARRGGVNGYGSYSTKATVKIK